MADGTCKVCNGLAKSNNQNPHSNNDDDRLYCESTNSYIWSCDLCDTSFHGEQPYPTRYDYLCPSCGTFRVTNGNKGINFY